MATPLNTEVSEGQELPPVSAEHILNQQLLEKAIQSFEEATKLVVGPLQERVKQFVADFDTWPDDIIGGTADGLTTLRELALHAQNSLGGLNAQIESLQTHRQKIIGYADKSSRLTRKMDTRYKELVISANTMAHNMEKVMKALEEGKDIQEQLDSRLAKCDALGERLPNRVAENTRTAQYEAKLDKLLKYFEDEKVRLTQEKSNLASEKANVQNEKQDVARLTVMISGLANDVKTQQKAIDEGSKIIRQQTEKIEHASQKIDKLCNKLQQETNTQAIVPPERQTLTTMQMTTMQTTVDSSAEKLDTLIHSVKERLSHSASRMDELAGKVENLTTLQPALTAQTKSITGLENMLQRVQAQMNRILPQQTTPKTAPFGQITPAGRGGLASGGSFGSAGSAQTMGPPVSASSFIEQASSGQTWFGPGGSLAQSRSHAPGTMRTSGSEPWGSSFQQRDYSNDQHETSGMEELEPAIGAGEAPRDHSESVGLPEASPAGKTNKRAGDARRREPIKKPRHSNSPIEVSSDVSSDVSYEGQQRPDAAPAPQLTGPVTPSQVGPQSAGARQQKSTGRGHSSTPSRGGLVRASSTRSLRTKPSVPRLQHATGPTLASSYKDKSATHSAKAATGTKVNIGPPGKGSLLDKEAARLINEKTRKYLNGPLDRTALVDNNRPHLTQCLETSRGKKSAGYWPNQEGECQYCDGNPGRQCAVLLDEETVLIKSEVSDE